MTSLHVNMEQWLNLMLKFTFVIWRHLYRCAEALYVWIPGYCEQNGLPKVVTIQKNIFSAWYYSIIGQLNCEIQEELENGGRERVPEY